MTPENQIKYLYINEGGLWITIHGPFKTVEDAKVAQTYYSRQGFDYDIGSAVSDDLSTLIP